ncbi:MAG: flocculation-associated PEP-CTERM protein PepA [Gammaproteobacteria bacterium]|nr:flocculation-associated PEP-CTERM protein PepA [Gammaproteobacteria bacterium]
MNTHFKHLGLIHGGALLACGALMGFSQSASALTVPWIGTADYTSVIGATNGEIVGPFNSYDFSNGGVVLIQPDVVSGSGYQIGDTYRGYYQSLVTQHMLSGDMVSSPKLNNNYELTVTTEFTQQVTAVDAYGNASFAVTGGNARLFLDGNGATLHNFGTDSGFNDGTVIMTGTVSGGGGTFFSGAGFGVTGIDLTIGAFDYNAAVFDPGTISGANSIFTMRINPFGVTSGVSSVQGNAVNSGDLLLEADGNLNLMAVPLPPALLLLATSILGLMGFSRRSDKKDGLIAA